jgi:hypothetical protein
MHKKKAAIVNTNASSFSILNQANEIVFEGLLSLPDFGLPRVNL